jgi:predicted ATPase
MRDGDPQMVTLVGQPGVGKTRLLIEFQRRLEGRETPVRVLRGRCLAFSSVVYWPLSEVLRSECAIVDGDSGAEAWSKLAGRLGHLLASYEGPEQVQRRLGPMARLVGAEAPDDQLIIEPEDEQSARESFFGAVRAVFEALAQEQSLLLAWEDIHWADQGTLDLIDYLSRWLRAPVLQLCLAREELLERRPSWSSVRRDATVTYLEPLAPAETRKLVEALLRATGTASELRDTLAQRSGGNPLFAEAIVTRIAEEDTTTAAELPDTVQGVLAARLDALDPVERELVAHASVIGRTFWESALAPIAARAGADLEAALRALRQKDIVVLGDPGRLQGERELSFKHVLIRDVAYAMLPKAVRARKHAEVAGSIEQRAGERGEGVAALLAEHYGRAATLAEEVHIDGADVTTLRTKALQFGEAAGDAAAALFSNGEAPSRFVWGESSRRSSSGSSACRTGRSATSPSMSQSCTARLARRWHTRASARQRSSSISRAST